MFVHPDIEVRATKNMGWGVFARRDIDKKTIIEKSPVVVMSIEEKKDLDKTKLHDYIFYWGEESEKCSMAMGYIPIYNHASPSNAEYYMDFDEGFMFVILIDDVKKDEQIFINYNGDFNNLNSVWFKTTN